MILHLCDRCRTQLPTHELYRLSLEHADPNKAGIRPSRSYLATMDRYYDLELRETCAQSLRAWSDAVEPQTVSIPREYAK